VVRNRVKRLLRETVRCNLEAVPVGWDCVLIARSPLSAATYSETEDAVLQLFQRAARDYPIERTERTGFSVGGRIGAPNQVQHA
jgi:RNase P protein component